MYILICLLIMEFRKKIN